MFTLWQYATILLKSLQNCRHYYQKIYQIMNTVRIKRKIESVFMKSSGLENFVTRSAESSLRSVRNLRTVRAVYSHKIARFSDLIGLDPPLPSAEAFLRLIRFIST